MGGGGRRRDDGDLFGCSDLIGAEGVGGVGGGCNFGCLLADGRRGGTSSARMIEMASSSSRGGFAVAVAVGEKKSAISSSQSDKTAADCVKAAAVVGALDLVLGIGGSGRAD